MWTIENLCMAGYLVLAVWMDIKRRAIPIWYLMIGSALAIGLLILERREMLISVGLGIIVGIGFLLLSKFSQQGIGYGDSWIILNLGVFLGVWKVLVLLMIAFMSVSILCGIGMWKKKLKRKSRVPFVPFLLVGYLGACVW